MAQLLDIDTKLVKEFDIINDLPVEKKLEYLDAQEEGMQGMIWRLRVDTMLNNFIEPENDDQKAEAEAKLRGYRNDIKQIAKGLKGIEQLRNELK